MHGTLAMRLSHRTRASDSCRSPLPQRSRYSKRAAPPSGDSTGLRIYPHQEPLGLVFPVDSLSVMSYHSSRV